MSEELRTAGHRLTLSSLAALALGWTLLLLTALPVTAASWSPKTSGNRLAAPFRQVITPTVTITPTATSTSTPPPTLEPIRLTAVEPARMQTESGGTLSVYGSGFTPDSVVRLIGFGLLPTTFINSSALTALVPPGVPPDRYDVEVGIGNLDGARAKLKEALRIRETEPTAAPTSTPVPTATPTATPTTAFVFGQPQLLIQSATITPAGPEPGQPFLLTMDVVNLGNYVAIDITVALADDSLAVSAAGSNARIIQRIGVEESAVLSIPLVLNESAPAGPGDLIFDLEYFDLNGRGYSDQQRVGLMIDAVTATPTPAEGAPRLVLTNYFVEPEGALTPGAFFDLHLTVANVGNGLAQNVAIILGGEDGAQLPPFALLNAGNVRVLGRLEAGSSLDFKQTMIVDGTADSGISNLPIRLDFEDSDGSVMSLSQVVTLLVQKRPQLSVGFYREPGIGRLGEALDLPIEVVNIGRRSVNISTITIASSALEISNGRVYLGPLDGGTSGSHDAQGIPQAGGQLEVVVTVDYLDDFNQAETYEKTLFVTVEEPEPAQLARGEVGSGPGEGDGEGEESFLDRFWRFIRGMIGLGS